MAEPCRKTINRLVRICKIYWSPLFGIAFLAWSALGAVELFSDEFASPQLQKTLRVGNHVPRLSLAAWIAVGLGVVVVASLRGIWRELKRVNENHLAELETGQAALAAERSAHEKTRADLERQLAVPVSHEHRDRLIAIARDNISSVAGSVPCGYFDGRIHGHDAKVVFISHFPEHRKTLDEWDEATVLP
jgi:hypothetical protein